MALWEVRDRLDIIYYKHDIPPKMIKTQQQYFSIPTSVAWGGSNDG